MTPHFIPIYGTSILIIGMLALFAGHNRRTGWRKQPSRFAQWLGEYYTASESEGSTIIARQQSAVPALAPHTATDAIAFTAQLMKMRGSLGTTSNAPVLEQQDAVHVLVHK